MRKLLVVVALCLPLSGCATWDAMSGPEREAAIAGAVATGKTVSSFLPFPFNVIAVGALGVAGTIAVQAGKKKKPPPNP